MTAPHPQTWLKTRPEGLFCEPGNFYVDPLRPVSHAIISHAHADHARPGHAKVLATDATIAIMRTRMGAERAGDVQQSLPYGEPLKINDVAVTLFPAGHVLGAAQILIEFEGRARGDFRGLQAPGGPDLRAVRAGPLRRVRDRGHVRSAGVPPPGRAG